MERALTRDKQGLSPRYERVYHEESCVLDKGCVLSVLIENSLSKTRQELVHGALDGLNLLDCNMVSS